MSTTITNPNVNVIPCGVCSNCPHYVLPTSWAYLGRCNACFTRENDGAITLDGKPCTAAVYCDDEIIMCNDALHAPSYRVAHMCEDDDRYHLRGDYVYADDGLYYSRDYANMNFYQCEDCGTWVTDYDDFDSELRMCRACADNYRREQNRLIGSWHDHKGYFEKVGDWFDDRTIGFEMEVEGYNQDHEATAHEINDAFPSRFVFEYDCSLYDGFEIISQPHTLEAFASLDLNALERLLVCNGYEETDGADSTGLHVHYSTAFLGDSENERKRTLARFVRFFDENFDKLCDMTERKDIGHSYRNCDENTSFYDYDDDDDYLEAQISYSRYVAVNCNNFYRGTFEVRLCDGTIRADKVRAWTQFNIDVMDYLRKHDTRDWRDVAPHISQNVRAFFGIDAE